MSYKKRISAILLASALSVGLLAGCGGSSDSGSASGDSVEAECERKEFAAAVNQFLCTLSADDRNIFVCRYWFFASIADIALRFKCSQSKVKTSLFRTRQKLRLYLSKEGLL